MTKQNKNQIRHGRRKSGTKYSILLMFSPLTISPIQYSWDSAQLCPIFITIKKITSRAVKFLLKI